MKGLFLEAHSCRTHLYGLRKLPKQKSKLTFHERIKQPNKQERQTKLTRRRETILLLRRRRLRRLLLPNPLKLPLPKKRRPLLLLLLRRLLRSQLHLLRSPASS